MPRDVDERKKRAALRKLRKAAALAEEGLGPPLSDWEVEFLEEVEQRIETYGSAFADPEKGGQDEPLSALQKLKLREIDRKARGKGKVGFQNKRSSFKNKRKDEAPGARKYVRNLEDDLEDEDVQPAPPPKPGKPTLVDLRAQIEAETGPKSAPPRKPDASPQKPAGQRPAFRVIEGGKADAEE